MLDAIMDVMNLPKNAADIQKVQTAHRLKLIEFWEIPAGANVLEIGCGQGDTLAALAHVVGKTGFVHGVDVAGENYGAPETLGQARERLLKSYHNIQMDFGVDVANLAFNNVQFDCVVLSHCIWYFKSQSQLKDIFASAKAWGKRLCLAEWNPCQTLPEQLAHVQAAYIQAVRGCYSTSSQSNIQTMFFLFK